LTKRVAVPVGFAQMDADSIMDRLVELEEVLGVDYQLDGSGPDSEGIGIILTVRRDMSDRLAVRIVKMVLAECGLSADPGTPYKVPDPR